MVSTLAEKSIWHAPSYYVQLCQPKCQIYEKTEYFEYATTVLKPNLFYFINLSGINNVILQGKVEDKILDEADILQKNCGISGHGIAGHYSENFLSD